MWSAGCLYLNDFQFLTGILFPKSKHKLYFIKLLRVYIYRFALISEGMFSLRNDLWHRKYMSLNDIQTSVITNSQQHFLG